MDSSRLVRVGDHLGFDVWARPEDASVIYIPVTRGSGHMVSYSRARPKDRIR
jgi:hypothetical protein